MKTNNFFIITPMNPTSHFSNEFANRVKDLFTTFATGTDNINVQNYGYSLSVNYDEETKELNEMAPYKMAHRFEIFMCENAEEIHNEIYECGEYAEVCVA